MIDFISTTTSIGLEPTPQGIKGARLKIRGKSASEIKLFAIGQEGSDVNPLYNGYPLTTSCLEGKDVLVRYLYLPITKEKDIEEALPFQAEPLLPFPPEETLLAYQVLSKDQEGSDLTLLAVRKGALEEHLDRLKPFKIEPEHIASVQSALCLFGNRFLSESQTYLIFHFQLQGITSMLIRDGKLSASFASSESLETFFQTLQNQPATPKNLQEWQSLFESSPSDLTNAFNRIKKEIIKMALALGKEVKSGEIEGVLFTGECATWNEFDKLLIQSTSFPLLRCKPQNDLSAVELQNYALPIGLALSSLPGQSFKVDFRQQELSYPHRWKRLTMPVAAYFASILFLCASFYFFGQNYLHYQSDQLKQSYIDLLTSMHRSYNQFEIAFKEKNPTAYEPYAGEIPRIDQLDREELSARLAFLQREIQSSPDSFPLHANIPRVSDVLAWLTHHPAVISTDDKGIPETRLQIDSFSYMMIKRPQHGKQQEKYQVKIELEFTSPTPKWAREFHDALIEPNDWVDPKGEVKWNTNRGKYRTSFFLKDKTSYPSN